MTTLALRPINTGSIVLQLRSNFAWRVEKLVLLQAVQLFAQFLILPFHPHCCAQNGTHIQKQNDESQLDTSCMQFLGDNAARNVGVPWCKFRNMLSKVDTNSTLCNMLLQPVTLRATTLFIVIAMAIQLTL